MTVDTYETGYAQSRERFGLTITDSWEYDLRDFDGSFLWACWAIVRGIAQYRAATVVEPAKAAA